MANSLCKKTGSPNGMATRLVLLAACSLIALPGVAAAQSAAAHDQADSDDVILVTGVRTTTSTKTDAALTEIPQSVSVISAETFKDRAALDLQDVFRYSAGVATELNGLDVRGDQFSARGFSTVQYLDGLNRQPSFIYGGRLEIFTVERAEVIRGPSSTLYGAGGVGGLFNAVSKKPKERFGADVGLIFGTQGRKEVQLDVTGPLADGVSARLVALARDGHLIHKSQADDRILINPSITFKPAAGTEITLIGLYQKDSLGTQTYVPISKTIAAVNAADRISNHTFLGEPDFNHMDSHYKSATLLIDQKFGDVATFNSRTRVFRADADYGEIYGNAIRGYADPATRRRILRNYYVLNDKYDGWASDNNLTFKVNTGPLEHQLLFGVDYTYFNQDRREGFPAAPDLDVYNPVYGVGISTPPFTNFIKTTNTNLGFYAQEQLRAWDRVTLLFGVRHDKVTSKITRPVVGQTQLPDNKAWTFRAGIIGDIIPGVSPYFNYAESFLPVFGSTFVGVPYVARPGRQYEAGVKFVPKRGSMISVALYDIQEKNYISRDPNNIQNFIQQGAVGSKGVEFEASLALPDRFNVTVAYSYTDAKWIQAGATSVVGDRVDNLPKHQASFWGTKDYRLTDAINMKIGGGVRYGGDKIDAFQNFITPATTVADAMVEFTYEDWRFGVNASNIFNTTVYTQCSRNPANPEGMCYLARDRSILASVRRKF